MKGTDLDMDILALDFDGVVCDSAVEMAATAWLCAVELWPEEFKGTVSKKQVQAFRECRPVIEIGYESILLHRLLASGHDRNHILSNFKELRAAVMKREGLEENTLVTLFGRIRDEWIQRDPESWLKLHEFYPGVVEALNKRAVAPIYIITTKQKRFACSLVRRAGININDSRIFGLESGNKGKVLTELSQRHPGAVFHFVEDRFKTLEAMKSLSGLDVRLYFAIWGYNTAGEQSQAAGIPGIAMLELTDFIKLVKRSGQGVSRL